MNIFILFSYKYLFFPKTLKYYLHMKLSIRFMLLATIISLLYTRIVEAQGTSKDFINPPHELKIMRVTN